MAANHQTTEIDEICGSRAEFAICTYRRRALAVALAGLRDDDPDQSPYPVATEFVAAHVTAALSARRSAGDPTKDWSRRSYRSGQRPNPRRCPPRGPQRRQRRRLPLPCPQPDGSAVSRMLDGLLHTPAITAGEIQAADRLTAGRASQILRQLAVAGFVRLCDRRTGRARVRVAQAVIDAIDTVSATIPRRLVDAHHDTDTCDSAEAGAGTGLARRPHRRHRPRPLPASASTTARPEAAAKPSRQHSPIDETLRIRPCVMVAGTLNPDAYHQG